MVYIIVAYVLTLFIVTLLIYLKNNITKKLPVLRLSKDGIVFYSKKRHKIVVGIVKILEMNNAVYIKNKNKTIILKNVKNVINKNNYLYFTAKGEVKILFNVKPYFRYFNIKIISPSFDISSQKYDALNSMINNLFSLHKCAELTRYINVITNILNITITDQQVIVGKNKYNLNYTLVYKLNNTYKRVLVNSNV